MMRRFGLLRAVFVAGLWLAALLGSPRAAAAETLLRWKLQPGEQFALHVTHHSDLETDVKGKRVATTVDMLLEMHWQIEAVDENSVARIKQTIRRMRLKMDAPSVGSIEFDSAADAPAQGEAKDIAAGVKPLIGAAVTLGLDARGKIVDVELPDETLAALKAAPAGNRLRDLFTKEGLAEMLGQSFVVLPEAAVEKGFSWTEPSENNSPLGQLKQQHKFTYEGSEDRDGRSLEKIAVASTIELAEPKEDAVAKLALKEQVQTGVLYFNAEAGRFVDGRISQSLATEKRLRDIVIRAKVKTTIDVRLESFEAEKPDE